VHDSVTIHIDASPDQVWALVSDVTKIGRYSPETFEAEWLDGATGPALGARFRGHVKRNGKGPTYWTRCVVTKCEPGRDFFFGVTPKAEQLSEWGYHLEPSGDGTDVTESFTLAPKWWMKVYWALLGRLRGRTNRRGMTQTLQRIKAEVESGG
jgi:hypothetical protein